MPDPTLRHPALSTWTLIVSLAPLMLLASAAWLGLAVYRLALPRANDGFWAFAAAAPASLFVRSCSFARPTACAPTGPVAR